MEKLTRVREVEEKYIQTSFNDAILQILTLTLDKKILRNQITQFDTERKMLEEITLYL